MCIRDRYYGVPEAGAVLLPLNIRLAPDELAFILNDSGATILFVEKQFLGLVESFRKSLRTVKMFVQLDGSPDAPWLDPRNYDALLAAATPHRADISSIDENSLAELFYTSGTSANPKGVMLTHRNIYLHALNVCMGLDVYKRQTTYRAPGFTSSARLLRTSCGCNGITTVSM